MRWGSGRPAPSAALKRVVALAAGVLLASGCALVGGYDFDGYGARPEPAYSADSSAGGAKDASGKDGVADDGTDTGGVAGQDGAAGGMAGSAGSAGADADDSSVAGSAGAPDAGPEAEPADAACDIGCKNCVTYCAGWPNVWSTPCQDCITQHCAAEKSAALTYCGSAYNSCLAQCPSDTTCYCECLAGQPEPCASANAASGACNVANCDAVCK